MTTAQASWGNKAPERPIIRKEQEVEQTEEDMLMNWKSIKERNS